MIQYSHNPIDKKVDFIIDLYTELMKVKLILIIDQTIKNMISDIREYLQNGKEYKTNQAHFRMKYLFYSFVINI